MVRGDVVSALVYIYSVVIWCMCCMISDVVTPDGIDYECKETTTGKA